MFPLARLNLGSVFVVYRGRFAAKMIDLEDKTKRPPGNSGGLSFKGE